MKKVIGIILTFVLSVAAVSYAFAEGLVLSGNSEDVAVNDVVEFEFVTSDWAKDEVMAANEKKLIPEHLMTANLTKDITRAEFAAIAVNLYENLIGEEVYVDLDSMPFDDIDKSLYHDEIIIAYSLAITNGTAENTFSPDALITREQMAAMILRTLFAAEIDVNTEGELILFSDNDEISAYAQIAVFIMAKDGIINGVGDNKFAPKATATREQAILIAYRNTVMLKKETVGNTLRAVFTEAAENGNIYEIAESLVSSPAVSAMPLTVTEVEEGYLAGFDNTEITGFSEGVMFAPMIGTIPFVGYVFTLEDGSDTDAFIEKLETSANLRWNICVRAEEMVTGKSGNKVFFVMCNKSLE